MEKVRSFIAIEIPASLRARMDEILRTLKQTEGDVKWVRPEGIHLTLKFLGPVSEETLEKVAQAVQPVVAARDAFDLQVQGLGCFPSSRNPRVVWVGIEQGKGEAAALQKLIEEKTADLGFPPESRPFSPHLTLGRVRSPRGRVSLAEAIEKNKGFEVGVFRPSEVFLFRSDLKPSGAVYTKLKNFPMKG